MIKFFLDLLELVVVNLKLFEIEVSEVLLFFPFFALLVRRSLQFKQCAACWCTSRDSTHRSVMGGGLAARAAVHAAAAASESRMYLQALAAH